MKTPGWVLPVIVVSQFFCTSLWFAGNAVMPDIARTFNLDPRFVANLTSAVQFGFITGTFFYALLAIADRFSPSAVFFISALSAAVFNLGIVISGINITGLLFFRFLTGFFIAGVYPVGMKIASDYYQKGLGRSLGFLVGALVLGTAFPHLLKSMTLGFSWKYVVFTTTGLSVLGGLCVFLLLADGPYSRSGQKLSLGAFLSGFRRRDLQIVSFGYFGHMWELYTFWAFVPVMLAAYNKHYSGAGLNVSLFSFLIIASGGPACVAGGYLSQQYGTKRIATIALLFSCLCCIVSPVFLFAGSAVVFIAFLFLWSCVVIADSPLFSTLVAQGAPAESRGSSLTIVNCIGFSITIISIQVINLCSPALSQYVYMLLAVGPVLGLMALLRK
jgi:MFS family permease